MTGGEARWLGDRYRLDERIGSGGMGSVYRGWDDRLRRVVGIKVATVSSGDGAAGHGGSYPLGDPTFVALAFREARAAAALNHPNIVTMYDVGEHDGTPYVVMELVEGRSLREHIHRGGISISQRISWLIDIARALGAAHLAGLVHRDVKPDNVLVTPTGTVKVLDFGIAKRSVGLTLGGTSLVNPELAGLSIGPATAEGSIVGTPAYMAPEQVCAQTVDGRADQFSWGVMAYELLSGVSPWQGVGDTIGDMFMAVMTLAPVPLGHRNAMIPTVVLAVVHKAMMKARELRFASMNEVVAALTRPSASWSVAGVDSAGSQEMGGADTRVALSYSPPSSAAPPSALWSSPTPSPLSLSPMLPSPRAPSSIAPSSMPPSMPSSMPPSSRADSGPPSGSPATLRMLDVESPISLHPEAIEVYQHALARMRSCNWAVAYTELAKALSLDPQLAPALLRYALCSAFNANASTGEIRGRFLAAIRARDRLSRRDRALMRAIEPVLLFDPPEGEEGLRRARELCESFPGDAELLCLAAMFGGASEPDLVRRAASRAVEIDPEYADAWQQLGHALASLELFDEARLALERCVEVSPEAADGHTEAAILAAALGDAQGAERHARRALSIVSAPTAYRYLLGALFARGTRRESLRPLMRNLEGCCPPSLKTVLVGSFSAGLDILYGDFESASHRLETMRAHDAPDDATELRCAAFSLGIELALERGDRDTAADLAIEYLDTREAFPSVTQSAKDVLPICLAIAVHRKHLDRASAADERSAWIARAQSLSPGAAWALAFSPWILLGDLDAIEEARASIPPIDRFYFFRNDVFRADAGLVLLRLGELDRALGLLRMAACACLAPGAPFRSTRASLWLGEACELRGLRDEAMGAYRTVLTRWGNVVSTSAQLARARLDLLLAQSPDPPAERDRGSLTKIIPADKN